MPRVNLDDSVWTSTRVRRLARRRGWNMRETVGTLAAVWNEAYGAKSPNMSPEDVDTAAEADGFAADMVAERLAFERPDGQVRLAGVEERIEYLIRQAERGRKGGLTRAKREADAKQTLERMPKRPSSLPPPPALAPDLHALVSADSGSPPPNESQQSKSMSADADAPPKGKAKGKRPKPHGHAHGPTREELASVSVVLEKLGARTGVRYQLSKAHTALITARLRDGFSEMDLRAIIGYCAVEKGWLEDPKMRPYLRPETLFGPETVHRYVYQARAWLEKIPTDDRGQKRPGATIHPLPLRDRGQPENVQQNANGSVWQQAVGSLAPDLLEFDPEETE